MYSFNIFHYISIVCLLIVAAFVLTVYLMPHWISFIKKVQLLDKPDHRKLHTEPTPSMGGVIIVFTILAFSILPISISEPQESVFIIVSIVWFAVIGFFDDWKDLNAKLKLFLQIAFATVAFALGYRIDFLFGIFGIGEIGIVYSYILTLGFYILIVNAYNLIDGVDGLAGGLLLVNFFCFGLIFVLLEAYGAALFCAICFGAIIGFLRFNFHPAKIFMGDAGSLPMGMLMGVFTIKVLILIQTDTWVTSDQLAPMFVSALLAINAIPLFDTIRVFAVRLSKGKSPFNADRIHLHHIFMKNRFGHRKVCFFIHAFHLAIILTVTQLSQFLREDIEVFLVLIVASTVFEINTYFRLKRKKVEKTQLEKKADQYMKNNKRLSLKNQDI